MDPAVMDPSHPGYPAWIAGKYPDATLDEINGITPPPASPRNGIVLPPAGPDNGIVPAQAPQLSVAPSHPPQPIHVAVVPIPLLPLPPSIHQPVLPNGGLVLDALTQQVLAVPARRRQARELATMPRRGCSR